MDLDTLLHHYFDNDDLDQVDAATLAAGQEKLAVDFGTEHDPSRRFALWTLMEALGTAPTPADAFKEPEQAHLRRAAEEYLTAAWRLERD